MSYLPICAVDIVLFDTTKTKILLFKRTNEPLKGEYFSSGGRLLKNEGLSDGIVRQTKKELGITIHPDHLIFGGVLNEVFPNSSFGQEVGYHTVVLYWGYILQEDTAIVLDAQHTDHKWFDINDDNLHPYIKEYIRNVVPKL